MNALNRGPGIRRDGLRVRARWFSDCLSASTAAFKLAMKSSGKPLAISFVSWSRAASAIAVAAANRCSVVTSDDGSSNNTSVVRVASIMKWWRATSALSS